MRIENIHIKGFRNFDDEKITFQDKTLIIGANDVGKTNLIYALRLLLIKVSVSVIWNFLIVTTMHIQKQIRLK